MFTGLTTAVFNIQKNFSTLGRNEIMHGVLKNWSFCFILNHIFIGKYRLCCKALNWVKIQFSDFLTLLQERIKIEKYKSVMTDKCSALAGKMVRIVHFTVTAENEARVDLVLIQPFLLYYVNHVALMLTSIFKHNFHKKRKRFVSKQDQLKPHVLSKAGILNPQL